MDFNEQVIKMIGRLSNRQSRAGSTTTQVPPKNDARVTEIINGVSVSKPSTTTKKKEKEPEITILNDSWERQKSKAASVQGINKVKIIAQFISKGIRP